MAPICLVRQFAGSQCSHRVQYFHKLLVASAKHQCPRAAWSQNRDRSGALTHDEAANRQRIAAEAIGKLEAKAAEITLIRADPSSDQWFLPAEEVERLAQANGIPDVPLTPQF
ncbi:hypothetical protein B4Q13_23650 [Lacticaseibacillus rhamnosus]